MLKKRWVHIEHTVLFTTFTEPCFETTQGRGNLIRLAYLLGLLLTVEHEHHA